MTEPSTDDIVSQKWYQKLIWYPDTLTRMACSSCIKGCDKPGLGHPNHDPYDNSLSDCAACCIPITIPIDIILYPFYCFGMVKVKNVCGV